MLGTGLVARRCLTPAPLTCYYGLVMQFVMPVHPSGTLILGFCGIPPVRNDNGEIVLEWPMGDDHEKDQK